MRDSIRQSKYRELTGESLLRTIGRGTQVVRERSAKPLYVGSIPTRASRFFLQLLAWVAVRSDLSFRAGWASIGQNWPNLALGADKKRTRFCPFNLASLPVYSLPSRRLSKSRHSGASRCAYALQLDARSAAPGESSCDQELPPTWQGRYEPERGALQKYGGSRTARTRIQCRLLTPPHRLGHAHH
jgi:hypothetical protein